MASVRPAVFISYSSKDRHPFVVQLAEDLQRHGVDVWLDIWRITGRHPYWSEIQAGVEACTHLLFVISPDSIAPGSGALDELSHARHHRKTLVPVMAKPVDFDKLPIEITPGRYQMILISCRLRSRPDVIRLPTLRACLMTKRCAGS